VAVIRRGRAPTHTRPRHGLREGRLHTREAHLPLITERQGVEATGSGMDRLAQDNTREITSE
jgi:hypothetical protein